MFLYNCRHSLCTLHLKHTIASAVEWSEALGGPKKSTVKKACEAKIKMLPFLDEELLVQHMLRFIEEVLIKKLNIKREDIGKIPIQASMDATATTGRFRTRKGEEDGDRIIYGVSTSRPTKKTFLSMAEREDGKRVTNNINEIRIHGMEYVLDLVDAGSVKRSSLYMTIVLLPLMPDSRPYCVGMYSVAKGSNTSVKLSTAHNVILSAAKKAGLAIVSLPGDGDAALRNLQWSMYRSDRGWDLFGSSLLLPLQLKFDSNGDLFRFPLQDMLHNLKKGMFYPLIHFSLKISLVPSFEIIVFYIIRYTLY